MEKNIIAIIQARRNSSRFPNKILSPLGDKTLLEHVIENIQASKHVNNIVLATTNREEDSMLQDYASKYRIIFTRGETENVLARFYSSAKISKATDILRITADDPIKPVWMINKVIEAYKASNHEYASNNIELTYPEGFDTEIFSMEALTDAYKYATKKSDLEHVTPYIKRKFEKELLSVKGRMDNSWARLTVDYLQDLKNINEILQLFKNRIYESESCYEKVCMDTRFKVLATSQVERNEGYNLSVRHDE